MKKLMTMIAAVATAFGLYAAEGDIDSFDAATGSLTDGRWSYTNAVITSENLPPSAEVSITGEKLVLATGTKTLSRNYPDAPVSITGDALYLDTKINFDAPFEEVPTVADVAKIAAFVLDNSELVAEMREKGETVADEVVSTNLYAIASYWDATANEGEGAWVPAAFMFDTAAAALDNKQERRLTVKAYKNVLADDTRMGFRFFLDGVDNDTTPAMKVLYVFPIVDGAIDFTSPIVAADPTTPYLGCEATKIAAEVRGRVKSTDRSLLISLAGSLSLNALDFAGKGAIGSLLLTATAPSFIEDDAYTMEVETEGVASVMVTGAEYQDGVITFAAGTESIGVTATYNDGCTIVKWTYQGGDVTPNPVTAEQTISPVKGATLNIRAVAPGAYVDVNGVVTPYETFAEALTAVDGTGGTLKLAQDVTDTASYIEFTNTDPGIVLDLGGKTITGGDYTTIYNNSGVLTITNSVGTGHVAAFEGSSIINAGTLTIAEGVIDGSIANGFNETPSTLYINGGTFDGAISREIEGNVLVTTGGNFKKGAVFGTEEPTIPGVPESGYEVVDTEVSGYWTVQEIETYAITVLQGVNGTVEADKATAAAGETVTVTATPDANYHLVSIMTNNTPLAQGVTTFEMPAEAVEVSATFAIDTFTVTFKVAGQADDTETVNWGEKVTKPTDPSKVHATFTGWFAEGAESAFDFDTPITKDVTLTAQFRDWMLYYADLYVDGAKSDVKVQLGNGDHYYDINQEVLAERDGVMVNPAFIQGAEGTWFVSKLVKGSDTWLFGFNGTTLTQTNGTTGVTLNANVLSYTVTTGSDACFAAVYLTKYVAPSPVDPVDPGEEKKYDTTKEAEDAAKNINDHKDTMINVPTEASGDKAAYLARVAAKVEADGLTVVVDIADDAKDDFQDELDTEVKKTGVAAALTDATATKAAITTVPGFYYWVEGGVEVGTINTNGKAEIGTGSAVELTKPTLGTTTKAFYKLAVGIKAPIE